MPEVSLFCGNCIDYLSSMPVSSVDLILTDPPYNIGNFAHDRGSQIHTMRPNHFTDSGWDDEEVDDWKILMDQFFESAAQISKPGTNMIVFMSYLKTPEVIEIAERHGFYYKTTGTWHKTNPMPRNMNLHFVNSTEPWLYFVYKKRTGTFNNEGKCLHDFIETSVTPKSERRHGKHPTQKPLALMDHFVSVLSNPGDLVIDPFMGSGSSGISALRNNRSFIGIELDEKYFEIAQTRINDELKNTN